MRTALYVVYEKSGRLPKDVQYMIKALRSISEQLVVIVNGYIKEQEILTELADYLIVRENKGFDAGAYKVAFSKVEVKAMIDKSSSLIFCNSTFYGPFIPFQDIFSLMDRRNADFWGLNYSDNGLVHFLQSYFIVFNRKIIEDKVLGVFFDRYINENTTDIVDVLMNFERGLFRFLVRGGYQFDAFCRQTYHIFYACDGSVCLDKLPILKKKAFSEKYFNRSALLNCLKYIEDNYDYGVNMILEDINNRYGIVFSYDEVKGNQLNIQAEKIKDERISREELFGFCNRFKQVYIYGTGNYCRQIMDVVSFLDEDVVVGYIVSDGKKESEYFEGKRVYELSELEKNLDVPIVVALGTKNTQMVKPYLSAFKNVLLGE